MTASFPVRHAKLVQPTSAFPTPDDPVHLLPVGIGFQGQHDFFLDNATARCRVQHP
jgi:hypothetical protein